MVTAMKKHLGELNFPPAQTVSKAHDAVRLLIPPPPTIRTQLILTRPSLDFRILDDILRYNSWSEIDLAIFARTPSIRLRT